MPDVEEPPQPTATAKSMPAKPEPAKLEPAIRQSSDPRLTYFVPPKPLPAGAVTDDWPTLLGPNHNATTRETKLLKTWPKGGPQRVWELQTGAGYAAPSVQGGRLVFFHREGDEEVVECFAAETGARHWRFAYATDYQDRFGYSDGPRCSPVIAGEHVYTYGAQGRLHCLKLASGELVWRRDLSDQYKVPQNFFGVNATPLVEADLLIVNVGAPGGPAVVGLDRITGKERWRAGDRWGASCATPVPATVRGKRRVFVFAGGKSRPPTGGLLSLEPATGRIDFRFPWRSDSYESVNASSPVAAGDRVFVTASYRTGGALVDVRPDMSHQVAWTTDKLGSHFGSVIHEAGYLYGCDGRHQRTAALVCIELATGREVWREAPKWEDSVDDGRGGRRTVSMGVFRAMLVRADGATLCLGEMGHLLWLDLTPKGYGEIARAWLFAAAQTWTPPVISRGLLYVCQNARGMGGGSRPRLICYDLRAPAK